MSKHAQRIFQRSYTPLVDYHGTPSWLRRVFRLPFVVFLSFLIIFEVKVSHVHMLSLTSRFRKQCFLAAVFFMPYRTGSSFTIQLNLVGSYKSAKSRIRLPFLAAESPAWPCAVAIGSCVLSIISTHVTATAAITFCLGIIGISISLAIRNGRSRLVAYMIDFDRACR